jgi:hypothetical protein
MMRRESALARFNFIQHMVETGDQLAHFICIAWGCAVAVVIVLRHLAHQQSQLRHGLSNHLMHGRGQISD